MHKNCIKIKDESRKILQNGIFIFVNDRKKIFITIFVCGQLFSAIWSAWRFISGGPSIVVAVSSPGTGLMQLSIRSYPERVILYRVDNIYIINESLLKRSKF